MSWRSRLLPDKQTALPQQPTSKADRVEGPLFGGTPRGSSGFRLGKRQLRDHLVGDIYLPGLLSTSSFHLKSLSIFFLINWCSSQVFNTIFKLVLPQISQCRPASTKGCRASSPNPPLTLSSSHLFVHPSAVLIRVN